MDVGVGVVRGDWKGEDVAVRVGVRLGVGVEVAVGVTVEVIAALVTESPGIGPAPAAP